MVIVDEPISRPLQFIYLVIKQMISLIRRVLAVPFFKHLFHPV